MSASDEWTEWHLTSKGWEEGTQKIDFVGIKEKPIPHDRVLTCRYREHLGSSFGKLRKTSEVLWRSQDNAEVEKYLAQFGKCPQSI